MPTNNVELNKAKVRALMAEAGAKRAGTALEKAVDIDYESMYEERYTGKIVFRRPSVMDYMKIGAMKAQFLGGNGAVNPALIDRAVLLMAEALATLKIVTVKVPDWLLNETGEVDFESIQDPDMLLHLFEVYQDWEYSFRTVKGREDAPDESAGTSATSGGTEAVEPS